MTVRFGAKEKEWDGVPQVPPPPIFDHALSNGTLSWPWFCTAVAVWPPAVGWVLGDSSPGARLRLRACGAKV